MRPPPGVGGPACPHSPQTSGQTGAQRGGWAGEPGLISTTIEKQRSVSGVLWVMCRCVCVVVWIDVCVCVCLFVDVGGYVGVDVALYCVFVCVCVCVCVCVF